MNDYISRKAAINTANTMRKRCDTECIDDYHSLMVESLSVLPAVDEWKIITEYCLKRNLVVITMEFFNILQAHYNMKGFKL